jgi:hypothetical protein
MILSPIILNEYSAQSFLNEYSAQSFLNDYSAQLFCYNAQIFATMLGHLIILTAIRRCCSAQSFFGCYYAWGRSVIFQNDWARSWVRGQLMAWSRGHGAELREARVRAGPSHAGSCEGRLTRLGPGDGSLVHHPRWWITAPYIYDNNRNSCTNLYMTITDIHIPIYTCSPKFHTSNSWGGAGNGHELDTTLIVLYYTNHIDQHIQPCG